MRTNLAGSDRAAPLPKSCALCVRCILHYVGGRADVAPLRFHCFRPTHAMLLLTCGADPKVASERPVHVGLAAASPMAVQESGPISPIKAHLLQFERWSDREGERLGATSGLQVMEPR